MPRSSRHKSHRQSKHREKSESEEDVKMKERNGKEEAPVRVSKDSGSSEKRKLSVGKDPSSEEHGSSKRRKEKAADVTAAADRWNGRGDDRSDGVVKEVKGESSKLDADKSSKSTIEGKSKTSRKHDGEKKEENVDIVGLEKEENKSSGRVDSKRKSEKDSGRKEAQLHKDSSELKEKERVLERERKVKDAKGEAEARAVGNEERQSKRGRENTDMQDELRNPELEKELEKRTRRRGDGSSEKDKYQEVKESEDRRLSSKGERAKDGRYKDEKQKDGSYGDKIHEDGDRESRKRDDKYREDAERESRHRDVKYREDGERDSRHRDAKYREDGERDNRHRADKYQKESERDNRHRDNNYREDGDRDSRHRDNNYREDGDGDNRHKDHKYHGDGGNSHRDDKYREDGGRDIRHRGDKYREDGDRDDRHRDEKYCEDGDRDGRRKDDWYIDDGNRDGRNKEEKNREDVGREGRHRDGKQRDDSDKDKRLREVKYQDERSSRDQTSDKSDLKRLRDVKDASELEYRKSNNRDGSPFYDDRSTRYKDDKGRRRTCDKEDHVDIMSRGAKEQHADAAKKSTSGARVESVSDRGRSNTHKTDLEITQNHSKRRSSPSSSSHAGKDNYRLVQQEESKYRGYVHEERVRHNMTFSKEFAGVAGVTEKASLSRSIEKSLQKDDSRAAELSAERRPKADARTSPLQIVDKSPSSMSNDRRHLNRSGVRRSLDIEDSGQRSKDAKDYSGREGRGGRELALETLPGDELSHADGDNFSVSSPFSRTSHLSNNSRSLLPPPPFRMGADSHLILGSLEDDSRGKSNNRHRRIGDPNIGRLQGSGWRGFPNWPSPVANGFIPFQHGPAPVGFHPMMQQFPAPPIFSVRPSMELNQSGVPYHLPDGSRICGQGRPLGWQNQVDDSCPPTIHGWDANNTVLGDEFHMYGRLDQNHNRTPTGGRVWETSGDAWKVQTSGLIMDLPSAAQKEDYSAPGPADELSAGQSVLHAQTDKKQPSVLAESIDIAQLSDGHEGNIIEDPKTISEEMPNLSRKDVTCLSHVYLSVLDISADLTQPELYSQVTSLMGVDQNTNFEQDDSKFLLVEETIDATAKIPNKTRIASLFPTINESVYQKAVSLYKKLREEVKVINGERVPFGNVENLESAPPLNQEGGGPDDGKPGEVIPPCDEQEAASEVSALNKVKIEASPPAITSEKIDEPVMANGVEKSEESNASLIEVKMECDLVTKQEALDYIVEGKSSYPENVEPSEVHSPGKVEEVSMVTSYKDDHCAPNNEQQKLHDSKCGPLLFTDVSSEAAMPESIESGSVNLSRIHQSPGSTH